MRYTIEHLRDNKILSTFSSENLLTMEGIGKILKYGFYSNKPSTIDSVVNNWYIGLIKTTDSAPVEVDTDCTYVNPGFEPITTMSSTASPNTTLPTWPSSAAAYDSANPSLYRVKKASSASVALTITADCQCAGAYLCDNNVIANLDDDLKSNNTLLSCTVFAAIIDLKTNDVLNISYTAYAVSDDD
jgi:hypothetical protein